MSQEQRVDLGFVKIHKRVIADIAASALKEVDGVKLASEGLVGEFFDLIGLRHFPDIVVTIDKDNQVNVEMKVRIRYGINISDVSKQIQDEVRTAAERTIDITLRDIQVNIQGIERGV